MIKLKNTSIKKHTIIIFILMYTLLFIIISINLFYYSSYEMNKTEKLVTTVNISTVKQLEEKLLSISDVSKYPLLIPEIDKLHYTLIDSENYGIKDYNFLKYLCEMMLIQNKSINGAFIYDINGKGEYVTRNNSSENLKNPQNEAWFKDIISSSEHALFTPNITFNNIFDHNINNTEPLIGLTRKIIDINSQKVTGVILVTLPKNILINIINESLGFNKQFFSVYNNQGELVLTTSSTDTLVPNNIELNYLNKLPANTLIKSKKNYTYTYNHLTLTNWILFNFIPSNEVNLGNQLYIIFFVINLTFFLILFIILFKFFIIRIFNPIETLITHMSNSDENTLPNNFYYNRSDEIGILISSYNTMKSRINNLININYKSQLEHKDLELKQLQNQINPHFIYNTLESIHMMAELNDDYETSNMSQSFGAIIRYSMNRKINTVSLKDEIDIIDNYIYLQKIRFDQLFTIENLVNPEVLNCEVIKMIIQPLIENAIYHGLSECSENGKIIIQGEKILNNLILTISDNGIGIDEGTVSKLNGYINDSNNDFKGIALRNVNRRLKLKYGEMYGLEIFSVLGKGTSMVLTLPYISMN